ncbi:MAG: ATP phosphoribosyltransferase regulatory subunit [Acidobacteria bacterium]|nr:ATP phosphoribosyltransferase regulatory subunit [Acidobacteriota bacterium]
MLQRLGTRFIKRERIVRLCYSGEVFRYDDPTQRATREFHQLGCEYIGESGIVSDIELLLVVAEGGVEGPASMIFDRAFTSISNGVAGLSKVDCR